MATESLGTGGQQVIYLYFMYKPTKWTTLRYSAILKLISHILLSIFDRLPDCCPAATDVDNT